VRKVILASRSKQRKDILKGLGLKFEVIPSNVKEDREIRSGYYAALVKGNALRKAKDVARRLSRGIVIAADTLVITNRKRIVGKPRNIKDARETLKVLSRGPQWVYTGLALVDIERNKTICDYEKTKVFMSRLSDREIKRYFRKIAPLDKAGSFDIQRQGSFFIRRIEGCFYNVVGLPVAKLYQMFKKIGISMLIAIIAINIFGCSTEYNIATGREDLIFYGTQKEVNLGRSISRAYEREFKLVEDATLQERVRGVGEKIVSVCDRRDINYYFRVVEDKEVNAVSLPGGYIYINQGLIDVIDVDTDDELACILAHEVGHIVAKHQIKKLQAVAGYTFLNILASQTTSPEFTRGMNVAMVSIMTAYSREDELLADKLAIIYSRRAGYNPEAMITVLEKLKEASKKDIRPINYFRTHPYISERIAKAKQILHGTMDFSDYLNIE
jgi:septum formation protein